MGAAIQPQPFGKYYLLERIATGGMAEIYKAVYKAEGGFEKLLVIKRILPHLSEDDEFVTMFRDEAKLTVRLSHANIVQVFDFGRIGTDHFLAMEYVQGQNMRQVMRRCQEMGATAPIPFALFACAEVAKGLQYAHSRVDENDRPMGIVHRDVTPSNILVSYEGEIKIADFGIAKAASRAGGTQAGMIKGKASYLSPEQVAGRGQVDGRADVFALGAVLWELLVGRKLFSGDGDFEIMNKILENPIRPPSEMNESVPPPIDKVVMRALARDPDARHPNAAALQKDLSILLKEYGGNVTSVDIANFLRRLFRKELESEREASKSLRRAVVEINDTLLPSAAHDDGPTGGERRGSASRQRPVAPANRPPVALYVAGAAILLVTVALTVAVIGLLPKGEAEATPTPLAEVTPVETEVAAIPVVTEEMAPLETATPKIARKATPAVSATVVAVATPAPTAAATAKPVSGKMGVLKLDSQPWGEIYIDGVKIGRQTPAFDLKVPVGKHQVRLVNPLQKLEASFEVVVAEQTPVKKVVKLAPMK